MSEKKKKKKKKKGLFSCQEQLSPFPPLYMALILGD